MMSDIVTNHKDHSVAKTKCCHFSLCTKLDMVNLISCEKTSSSLHKIPPELLLYTLACLNKIDVSQL